MSPPIFRHIQPRFWVILGYLLLWLGFRAAELPLWVIPFGLRVGVLLVTPTRSWSWLITGEWLIDLFYSGWSSVSWPAQTPGLPDLLQPLLVAACVFLARRAGIETSLERLENTTRLLLLAMATVTAEALSQWLSCHLAHPDWQSSALLGAIADTALDSYIGVLMLAPLLIMGFGQPSPKPNLAALLRDGWRLLLPALWVLLFLTAQPPPTPEFAKILSLAPVLYFAFSHGWRGACLSLLLFNLSFILSKYVTDQPTQNISQQLLVAVAGTGVLMMGTASDALRQSRRLIALQNRKLANANRQLDKLAQQLRAAARGNLYNEESQRRHLATELHDELGQNLTAIQTHIQLARLQLQQAGLESASQDVSASMSAILAQMRRSLHHVLNHLHPAVLDEFDLFRALDEGPIRELLEAANLNYQTILCGDPGLLDETASIALYRIAQESATNTVKHAQANEFRLQLRIRPRGAGWLALLDIRDNGRGLADASRLASGRGLKGMHDRITSLGGHFQVGATASGTRVRTLLRQAPPKPPRYRRRYSRPASTHRSD